jgi:hypothetical protein
MMSAPVQLKAGLVCGGPENGPSSPGSGLLLLIKEIEFTTAIEDQRSDFSRKELVKENEGPGSIA